MNIPDTLGLNLNEARREIRTNCPNLSIIIQETRSRKEPEFMGIEDAKVIKQEVTEEGVKLLVGFFADIYEDRIK
ncbi:hypothetical protein [Fusibacter sp. JL216-2]|uniref:hypothetical protein n=1 Tax=Fusibacter sp. JL216-2 TaxID=3071453 RepID=UPI003D348081